MRRTRWLLFLWPGLPQLWWRGAWSALAAAVGFALALDMALLATWVWSELLAASVRPFVWPTLGLVWVGGLAATAWRGLSAAAAADVGQREDLFPRTLGEYLRGNWLEAEILCRRLIERDAGDAEALLLLATVLRHARRSDEARTTLDQLRRLDAAEGWKREIDDEMERLAEQRRSQSEDSTTNNESSEPDKPQAVPARIEAPSTATTELTKPRLMDAA
jgi:Tetratricopeptide repeat